MHKSPNEVTDGPLVRAWGNKLDVRGRGAPAPRSFIDISRSDLK